MKILGIRCRPWLAATCVIASSTVAFAADGGRTFGGIPIEFLVFVATLLGVAVFHHHTLRVATTGLAVLVLYKLGFTSFDLAGHLVHESVSLANLLGLLLGFSLLADHFERSHLPNVLPKLLPDDWKGPLALLFLVFVISSFLDNIAAAMIGASVARTVFKGRVHVGYLAAIVGASNAGGSGSVVGDTTTTMMWIHGIAPRNVLHAYFAAIPAVLIFGTIASFQQDRHQRISKDEVGDAKLDVGRIAVVAALLLSAVATNVAVNLYFSAWADSAPWIALALWAAILVTAVYRRPAWELLPEAGRGAAFLLALVVCASLMPVEALPVASWKSAMALGYVSAVFDNIPLTALALKQGGYDWGYLAYAVGFGGSMMWFGSSAGVALSNAFPEAKNAAAYLRHGWHVPLAYTVGFLLMYAAVGWHPPAATATENAVPSSIHESR